MAASTTKTTRLDFSAIFDVRTSSLALILGSLSVAFGLAFFPTLTWIAQEWETSGGSYSHGYLVVAISIVLMVRAIPRSADCRIRPAWWAFPIIFGMSAVWLFAYVATVVGVQVILLPAIFMLTIIAAIGVPASRPLLFPVMYTYFALPALDHLQFIFQAITVFVNGILLHAVGITALVDGNFVYLPSGTFEIAGGCSGLNFILAGLSLAVLYGHLFYKEINQNVRLILLTLLVLMVGNWIRVFTIIIVGYRTEMQSSIVEDHSTLGWILFAVLMIPVFIIAARIESAQSKPEILSKPIMRESDASASVSWFAAVVAVLCMSAGPVWAFMLNNSDSKSADVQLDLPVGSASWRGPSASVWDWAPTFSGADAERVAQYVSGEKFILVYTNVFLDQKQDKELVYFSNRIAGNWHDAEVEGDMESIVSSHAGEEFGQKFARNYLGTWLIWYRYQVGDGFEVSATKTKIRQAMQAMRGIPTAGVIAFAVPCRLSCSDAAQTLRGFVDDIGKLVRVETVRDMKL